MDKDGRWRDDVLLMALLLGMYGLGMYGLGLMGGPAPKVTPKPVLRKARIHPMWVDGHYVTQDGGPIYNSQIGGLWSGH